MNDKELYILDTSREVEYRSGKSKFYDCRGELESIMDSQCKIKDYTTKKEEEISLGAIRATNSKSANISFNDPLRFQNEALLADMYAGSLSNNIQKEVYLKTLSITDTSLFNFSNDWQLTKTVNILLGKNANGKTFLLSILAALIKGNYEWLQDKLLKKDYQEKDDNVVKEYLPQLICTLKENQDETEFFLQNQYAINFGIRYLVLDPFPINVPLLAIPSQRYAKNGLEEYISEKPKADLIADGAKFLLEKQDFGNIINDMYVDIKDEYFAEKGKDSFENSERIAILENVFQQLRSHQESEGTGIKALKFLDIEIGNQNSFKINVEVGGHEISIKDVSQGIISILSIFSTIYNFLQALKTERGSETEITAQQAIVMIDELDAHLHPTWQLKIVNILHSTFPNVQFIITAHSPLLIQNCKKEQVHYLTRVEENKSEHRTYTIRQAEKDITEYSVFETLMELFEMVDKKVVEDYENYYEKDYQKFLKLKAEVEKQRLEVIELRTALEKNKKPTQEEQNRLAKKRKKLLDKQKILHNVQTYLHTISEGRIEVE